MFSLFCLLFSVFVCQYQKLYLSLVRAVPDCGIHATKLWYRRYQTVVRAVPQSGTLNIPVD